MKLIIFDLDGTLINSIEDLGVAVNHVLGIKGFPLHETEKFYMMVGNGVRNLMKCALPEEYRKDDCFIDGCMDMFMKYYSEHIDIYTKPYPGICELLNKLSKKGISLAIASNKFQSGTEVLAQKLFPTISFKAIYGNGPGNALKPSPEIVFNAMEAAGMKDSSPEDILFVGDSETDMRTAKNAGICGIAVTWGYRPANFLSEAEHIVNDTIELEELISKKFSLD